MDSMSDSCLFQLEEYFHSNPYREFSMKRPYIPLSAHSNRLNKSSPVAFHELIDHNPLTLDRLTYKLRMKSHLNVDTLPNTCQHRTSKPPKSATTLTRQPTAKTSTTKSILNGIEGNAVRVGTLSDIIKQYHQEEIRLIHQPNEYLDNLFAYTTNERIISKSPSLFHSERTIKQAQPLTEYRFHGPSSTSRKSPKLHLSPEQKSSQRQPSIRHSQESREKIISPPIEKQLPICNKLTILDPFNSNENHLKPPLHRYIFPPIRAFGYFRRKSIHQHPQPTSLPIRKRSIKTSPDQISSIDTDQTPQFLTDTNKSITTLTDLDDDFSNPPNTRVNMDLK